MIAAAAAAFAAAASAAAASAAAVAAVVAEGDAGAVLFAEPEIVHGHLRVIVVCFAEAMLWIVSAVLIA